MRFRATEDIQPNEEIFTHYGTRPTPPPSHPTARADIPYVPSPAGIHYFEQDNAGCLCATCEQLKRGGFAPKLKAEPAPFKRETTPTRKSTRTPAESVPGTGHELTAQRSIGNNARSHSPSSDSDSSTSSQPERRRNERRAVASPNLAKVQPRLVHPKLPPPPLYADDYEYDARKKVIKYVGCVAATRPKDRPKDRPKGRPSVTPSPLPQGAQAGKRTREEEPNSQSKRQRMSITTLTQTTSKGEKRTKTTTVLSSIERKTPLVPPKQPKTTTPSKSTFAPPARFVKPRSEDLSSSSQSAIEVITLDDTDGSTDEDQVASMLVQGGAGSRTGASFRAGSDSKPGQKESEVWGKGGAGPPTPRSPSPGVGHGKWGRPGRTEKGQAPADDGSPTPGGTGDGTASGAGQNGGALPAGENGGASRAPATSSGLGLGPNGGGIGGGAGGDEGEDREDRKPLRPYVASPVDLETSVEPEMQVDDTPDAVAGPSIDTTSTSVVGFGLPSPVLSSTGRDETDQEAARLLLAMGALFGSSSASTASTRTTFPASSSTTSVDDSGSAKSQLSAKAKGKRRATDGPATLEANTLKPERTNRRRSHLDEPSSGRSSLSPAGSGRSSADKRRVSQLGSGSGSTSASRSASGSRSPAPRPSPPPPVEGARGTRRSAPIKGGVHDLLSTPEVANVAGTFDARTGKYLSARRSASVGSGLASVALGVDDLTLRGQAEVESKPMDVEATPVVKAAAPKKPKSRQSSGPLNVPTVKAAAVTAAPSTRKPLVTTQSAPAVVPARASGRSTRSSFPMDATALDQLLHAPGAVGGSGYDLATGKYLPLRHKPDPTAPSPPLALSARPSTPQPTIYAASGTAVPAAAVSPAAAAAASAALFSAAGRSTRRTRPIDVPLEVLVRDPAVMGVAGAWDAARGRYVMPRRGGGVGRKVEVRVEVGEGLEGIGGGVGNGEAAAAPTQEAKQAV